MSEMKTAMLGDNDDDIDNDKENFTSKESIDITAKTKSAGMIAVVKQTKKTLATFHANAERKVKVGGGLSDRSNPNQPKATIKMVNIGFEGDFQKMMGNDGWRNCLDLDMYEFDIITLN